MELLSHEEIESLMIGDYKIIQSKNLYRFTSDSILLSRFAQCPKNAVVGDLCSGSGIVGLHFYALNSEKVEKLYLFEIQKELCDMSQKSIKLNKMEDVAKAINIPIQQIDSSLNQTFNILLCNPPYKKQNSGPIGKEHIAICKQEITVTIDEIMKVSTRLLKSGGKLVFCNSTDRLADSFSAMEKASLYPHRLTFLYGSLTQKPYLFICECYKGIKKQLVVEPPFLNDIKSISGDN